MNAPFRTIALIGKYQSPEIAESLLTLADFLRDRDVEVLIEAETATSVGASGIDCTTYDEIGRRAQLAIVLGGDGTLLNSARRLAEYEVPLVGINQGRLGFMTEIPRDSMLDSMCALLAGEFEYEQRFLLDTEVWRGVDRVSQNLALNDVVVNKGEVGRMIEFSVHIDGEFIYNQRSDGMIVCTPTGSTAYALSANGPILHPAVPGIALVPLCPHTLSARPITVSDRSRIEIRLLPPHEARVHFDGQSRFELVANDVVRVFRSNHTVRFLHLRGYNYFAMLREKLHWSETPRKH